MSTEHGEQPPLSEEQREMADFLIEECELQDHATTPIEMMGARGTVHYGLGRCARHLVNLTPAEIREAVLAKIDQQNQANV